MKKNKKWKKSNLIKLKIKDGKVEIHGKSFYLSDLLEMDTIKSEDNKKYFGHQNKHL